MTDCKEINVKEKPKKIKFVIEIDLDNTLGLDRAELCKWLTSCNIKITHVWVRELAGDLDG